MKETLSSINEPKPPSSSLHGMVVFFMYKKIIHDQKSCSIIKTALRTLDRFERIGVDLLSDA